MITPGVDYAAFAGRLQAVLQMLVLDRGDAWAWNRAEELLDEAAQRDAAFDVRIPT